MAELGNEPGMCSICERSMLAGERTRTYVTRDRDRREVCDLCMVRAESAGWVALELAEGRPPERREGGGTMRRLLGRARESVATVGRSGGEGDGAEASEQSSERRPPPRRRPPQRRPAREPAGEPDPSPEPTLSEPGASSRRQGVPQNPERRIRSAFDSFNASGYRATVRSLIRSLGGPYVSAVTTNDSPGEVRITVAWELSWYQYEVDLTSAGEPIRELRRGEELSQLSETDQGWNAHAAEDGELRTGLIGSQS
ncbi:MAG: hypothetical protein ACR2OC_07525 [Solirubrobacterales bacterium]